MKTPENIHPAGQPAKMLLHDEPSRQDALDFSTYVSALAEQVAAPETDTPLTLGIFGSWGSGKTTLMKLIETELNQHRRKDYILKTTWIDVWQLSSQGELWNAFLQSLFSEVHRHLSFWRRMLFDFQMLRDRVRISELIRQLVVNSYRVVIVITPLILAILWPHQPGQPTPPKTTGDLLALLLNPITGGAASLILGITMLVRPVLDAAKDKVSIDFSKILKDSSFEAEVSNLTRLKDQFEKMVQILVGGRGRVVVFIDDLDRCSPEKIIEVLDAIKLFATTKDCVYVIGLDLKAAANAVQVKFKEQGATDGGLSQEGTRYLEKIIQLPFMLPVIDVQDIRSLINHFDVQWPDEKVKDIFSGGLPPNPRAIKRAVNIYLLLWKLAEKRKEKQKIGQNVTPVRLAKVVVLQTSAPELFEQLRSAPELLKTIEDFSQKDPDEQKRLVDAGDSPKLFKQLMDQPYIMNLFRLHFDDPLAEFQALGPADMKAFFSLAGQIPVMEGEQWKNPRDQEPIPYAPADQAGSASANPPAEGFALPASIPSTPPANEAAAAAAESPGGPTEEIHLLSPGGARPAYAPAGGSLFHWRRPPGTVEYGKMDQPRTSSPEPVGQPEPDADEGVGQYSRMLSVFDRTCSLEALMAVWQVPEDRALAIILDLSQQGTISNDSEDARRYQIQRADAAGGEDEPGAEEIRPAAERHAQFYLSLLKRWYAEYCRGSLPVAEIWEPFQVNRANIFKGQQWAADHFIDSPAACECCLLYAIIMRLLPGRLLDDDTYQRWLDAGLSAARQCGMQDMASLLLIEHTMDQVFHDQTEDKIAKLLEAYAVSQELADPLSQAMVLIGLGRVCNQRGEPARAAEYLEEAIRVSEEAGNLPLAALAYSGLVDAKDAHGPDVDQQASKYVDAAISASQKAVEAAGRWALPAYPPENDYYLAARMSFEAIVFSLIAIDAISWGSLNLIEACCEEAICILNAIGGWEDKASVLEWEIQTLMIRGKPQQALQGFQELLSMDRNLGISVDTAYFYYVCAYVALVNVMLPAASGPVETPAGDWGQPDARDNEEAAIEWMVAEFDKAGIPLEKEAAVRAVREAVEAHRKYQEE